MANNDDLLMSTVDGVTPKSVKRHEDLPSILPMAGLETSTLGLPRDVQDKCTRSPEHSRSPEGCKRQRRSHIQLLESRLRNQDTIIQRMAAEMDAIKPHPKGKGVARMENHSKGA